MLCILPGRRLAPQDSLLGGQYRLRRHLVNPDDSRLLRSRGGGPLELRVVEGHSGAMVTTSGPVPDDVTAEVRAFVAARSHDPLPASATQEEFNGRWADGVLVRDYDRAREAGRRMTADNLALALLVVAARFHEHPAYQQRWQQWTPFGELLPDPDKTSPTEESIDHT